MSLRNFCSKELLSQLTILSRNPPSPPNSTIFADLLRICINQKSISGTRATHSRLLKTQFSTEVFIVNRLIDAYAKCHSIDSARSLFDQMLQRNTFSWNTMITGYAKSNDLTNAFSLFDSMPQPDEVSWNAIISGLSKQNFCNKALEFFTRMRKEGFKPDLFSYASILSACSGLMALETGIQIHGSIAKNPFYSDVYMGSALVDLYSKCGAVDHARQVFDAMPERNVVSWNSLITGYVQNNRAVEALALFLKMCVAVGPDEVTLASLASACAGLSAKCGTQVHGHSIVCGYGDDLVLGNALVDMYAKCGMVEEARRVFDWMPVRDVVSGTSIVSGYAKLSSVRDAYLMFEKMPERNVISWNALIAGYSQSRREEDALGLFKLMKREAIEPTHYTFGNVLGACANLSDLEHGRQIHTHVVKLGFHFESGPHDSDIFVGNSLVDMYAKCGCIIDAFRAFEMMKERDRISWNAMIMGYAQNGHGMEALKLYERMISSLEKPDHVTMIGVLCACSHAGLVEEGMKYFRSMTEEHGMVPTKDHYTCMVDLMGRAGLLNEAELFIISMPMPPDSILWGSLLAACRVHGNVELGRRVAERLFELDPKNSGYYVLLSNIFTDLGRWREAGRVRKLMRARGIIKQPGCSWIEIKNQIHVFMVRDRSHSQTNEIYAMLRVLEAQTKGAGYVASMFEMADE
ncbi:hypothetical protein AMTRI_Chr10g8230 [Amborella trichopoda]|uniref:pentatricopeptide repeat-containing protein At2g13600 n=1 Tax=Amborella trichopoda TaxID=13333 RepID=UPI0005D36BA3|nr:pentatricopeptide repeat-containing protein At2g13600 [Amborella trichopoda]|eukprot:XP_011628220.1 pentatricopeptide repeat-containing protein At2g13600 [Amborella trichopoda]